ncbi:MAG: hypothetical protein GY940_23920 [bacterium]|nr:hypothetical protein [bacterium]
MNYFFHELRSGNLKAIIAIAVMAMWFVALIDLLTSMFGSGAFGGKVFSAALIITIVSPIVYFIVDSTRSSKTKKKVRIASETADVFETRREKEVRDMLYRDPEFTTHCYKCVHFNPDLLVCKKKFSQDIDYKRIKEIKINDRLYCLYWDPGKRS